ncbi:MAG TPA: DUF5749 family beta-barrel protein [Candidatus Methanoperedens sp.]
MSLINKISLFFRKKNQGAIQMNDVKPDYHNYIGKFVKQNGTDIGESIAIDETRFIIKSPECFMSLPMGAILKNTENIEVGDFDREESVKLGKQWFEKKDVLKFDKNGVLILGARNSN